MLHDVIFNATGMTSLFLGILMSPNYYREMILIFISSFSRIWVFLLRNDFIWHCWQCLVLKGPES